MTLPLLEASTRAADVVGTITDLDAANAPISYAGNSVDNVLEPAGQQRGLVETPGQNLGAFGIFINAGPALAGNPAALAAFNRAANQWMARIADPITVTIDADLAPLPAGVLGSTSTAVFTAGYNTIRNAVVADAAPFPNNAIMASTPTAGQFSALVPSGSSLSGNLLATKANLKALGFAGLPAGADGTITFSSAFAFDFDNSNGLTPGTFDFETVAAHEIGHALGFISIVDSVVAGQTNISPFTLDLLRFRNGGVNDPATAADFTTFPRNLLPGGDPITDAINDPERKMSTGVTGAGTDGRQASHWKADELTGNFIGLMDPTISAGVFYGISEADWRALDLIGYNIVPEPTSLSILVLGGVAAAAIRRRRA
jgi:hypothetical protein